MKTIIRKTAILAVVVSIILLTSDVYAKGQRPTKFEINGLSEFYENGNMKHAEGDICLYYESLKKCYKNSVVEFTEEGIVKSVKKIKAASPAPK